MGFELRHLRNFLVVTEEMHFGRAAKRLSISQPPLSVSIQQLEEAVGARLLNRDSKGVRLTPAGEAFRKDAQILLSKADEASALAREISAGAVGRMRVGFVGSMLFRGLPQWVQAFQAQHPRIDTVMTELNSNEQIDALLRDELDVGFVHARRVPEGLSIKPLSREPLLACLPAGHHLAQRQEVALTMLSDEPFVLFSQRVSPEYYSRIIEMCAAAGYYPKVRHELRHWLSVVALVSQGAVVSIVPAALQRSGMSGVQFCQLANSAAVTEIYCVWPSAAEQPARDLFMQAQPAPYPAT
jgi:DNA-binding transcriptional LysR family regulator